MLIYLKCFDADVVDIPRAELPIQFLHSQLFQVLQQVDKKSRVAKKTHLDEEFPQFQDIVPSEAGSAFNHDGATAKQLGFDGSPGIAFMTSCNILYGFYHTVCLRNMDSVSCLEDH